MLGGGIFVFGVLFQERLGGMETCLHSESRRSGVQSQHPQHREFEANLGYMRACVKTKQIPQKSPT